MLRITAIGTRFVATCMVIGTMVVGSASAALAAPILSDDELEHMGLVEEMPADGGAGTWVVGGETFTADENTEFDTDEGLLEMGACAEVEYEAGADGNLALEIEGEDSPDCIDDEGDEDEDDDEEDEDDEDENEIFGTIETMPAGSDAPLGTWVIDGVSYVATADTEIEEEYGPFEVGANVELEFEVVDGVNQLTELETEPAPGEAPNTTEGVINSKGGVIVAASVSGSTAADATWVIGNTEYIVLGITAQEGALAVGSMAQVNSYTHTDGREIATLIRNVEAPSQNSLMYLPIVLQHG